MIFGTGVDIVEIRRMKDAKNKWGNNFLDKVFTKREIAYSESKSFPPQHFAARFAAKEAVAKAFGAPKKTPISWTDVEVLNDSDGKPIVKFHGTAQKLMKKYGIYDVVISMSHTRNYAVANAILLKKGAK